MIECVKRTQIGIRARNTIQFTQSYFSGMSLFMGRLFASRIAHFSNLKLNCSFVSLFLPPFSARVNCAWALFNEKKSGLTAHHRFIEGESFDRCLTTVQISDFHEECRQTKSDRRRKRRNIIQFHLPICVWMMMRRGRRENIYFSFCSRKHTQKTERTRARRLGTFFSCWQFVAIRILFNPNRNRNKRVKQIKMPKIFDLNLPSLLFASNG